MNCITCKHYRIDGTCDAFPDRIPLPFISGEKPHNKVVKGQSARITYEKGVNEFNKDLLGKQAGKPNRTSQRLQKMRELSRRYRG